MSYVLVSWEDNWADEMDVSGFKVFSKSEWNVLKTNINNIQSPMTFSIGTNEEIDYKNGSDLLKKFKVKDVSVIEYATLTKFFNVRGVIRYGENSVFDNVDYYF